MLKHELQTEALILGIDPGLGATGLGAIAASARGLASARLVESEVVPTNPRAPLAERLVVIHEAVTRAVERLRPDAVAIESVFYGKNVRSLILLAHARGAALLAAARAGCPVHEYSPLEIKQAVVGYGRAGKQQIQKMVRVLLGCAADDALNEHVSDALACALCHAYHQGRLVALRPSRAPKAFGFAPAADLSDPTGAKALLAQARTSRRRRGRR